MSEADTHADALQAQIDAAKASGDVATAKRPH